MVCQAGSRQEAAASQARSVWPRQDGRLRRPCTRALHARNLEAEAGTGFEKIAAPASRPGVAEASGGTADNSIPLDAERMCACCRQHALALKDGVRAGSQDSFELVLAGLLLPNTEHRLAHHQHAALQAVNTAPRPWEARQAHLLPGSTTAPGTHALDAKQQLAHMRLGRSMT